VQLDAPMVRLHRARAVGADSRKTKMQGCHASLAPPSPNRLRALLRLLVTLIPAIHVPTSNFSTPTLLDHGSWRDISILVCRRILDLRPCLPCLRFPGALFISLRFFSAIHHHCTEGTSYPATIITATLDFNSRQHSIDALSACELPHT
jgi:hypothetical protein